MTLKCVKLTQNQLVYLGDKNIYLKSEIFPITVTSIPKNPTTLSFVCNTFPRVLLVSGKNYLKNFLNAGFSRILLWGQGANISSIFLFPKVPMISREHNLTTVHAKQLLSLLSFLTEHG